MPKCTLGRMIRGKVSNTGSLKKKMTRYLPAFITKILLKRAKTNNQKPKQTKEM